MLHIRCRTLTGAWIEIPLCLKILAARSCRTLTGAWIEINQLHDAEPRYLVAPSRVRGLK